MKRRKFVKTLGAAGLMANTFGFSSCLSHNKKLKILVLGGTNFVGPSIVSAAIRNNHDVTLFNRGISNPQLFAELKLIKGDRELGPLAYEPLQKEKWDVIIDVWPEKSKLVDDATNALSGQTNHYIFISSIAVYNNFQEVGLHEESEVVSLNLSKDEWSYPEEKLAAENIVRKRFPEHHTILRCGAIKGWRDPALDLLYWCLKLDRDDSIIAPGSGNDPLQFVDVKDVGRFSIIAAENDLSGVYNCVGPQEEPLLWKEFLNTAKNQFHSQSELFWADENFLRENKISSFTDLPLWAPLSEDKGFMQISHKKIVDTGFNFTAINNTLRDCLTWYQQEVSSVINFGTPEAGIGLSRSQELRLIENLKG